MAKKSPIEQVTPIYSSIEIEKLQGKEIILHWAFAGNKNVARGHVEKVLIEGKVPSIVLSDGQGSDRTCFACGLARITGVEVLS